MIFQISYTLSKRRRRTCVERQSQCASELPFLQSSKYIEGIDISRLKLQLFEGSSPSVKTKPAERTNPGKQYSSTTDRPKTRAYRIHLKSDFLCNVDNDEQDTRKTEERTSCDEKLN